MTAEKYRPGSGTEGDCFFAAWCYQCARHHTEEEVELDTGEFCEIVHKTFLYPATNEQYPKEWVIGKNGPECTAFVPKGEPIPLPRCKRTVDMFDTCACLITNLDGHCVECGRVPS